VVKIFAFFDLEPRLNMKYGFNWAGKIEHFETGSFYKNLITKDIPIFKGGFHRENRFVKPGDKLKGNKNKG